MKTKEQNVETLILEKMNIMTRFGGFCSSNNTLWISTLYLYLIGVERIQESQEPQSTTHLGKEVQDSKGANTCPFILSSIGVRIL